MAEKDGGVSLHLKRPFVEVHGQAFTCMQSDQCLDSKHTYMCIGVGRFRILGGPRFRILGGQGGPNSQQAHDVISTSCAH